VAFHEKFLLPFYDCYLKGQETAYLNEPNVRYFVGAPASHDVLAMRDRPAPEF
jgi:hypothetical protein